MDADIQGCLNAINKSYKIFEHNGQPMTKEQVKAVLEFGLKRGYKGTDEINHKDIDRIIFMVNNGLGEEDMINDI